MWLYGAVGRWAWGVDQGNGMGRSGPSCDWWAGIGLRGGGIPGNDVYGTQMGPFFARAGRGFVSSEIKCNIAMSRPTWQEVVGHSGLAECCFEILWKGHSGSR